MENERVSRTVTVTPVERPARRLILRRSVKATDYLSLGEEIGCDWEGIFNSIPERLDDYCMVELPPALIKPDTGPLAFGVEVPLDYAKPLPAECDAIDLPACRYLEFHGAPYANEDDFPIAYEIVYEAVGNYQPEQFGWQFARSTEPTYIYDANGAHGAREAVPVTKTK